MSDVFDALATQRNASHVRVDVAMWADVAMTAKNDGFNYFCFLSGIDWLENPGLDGEKVFDTSCETQGPTEVIVDETTRLCGGTTRFSVVAHLENLQTHESVTLYADLDEHLRVPTWTHVFPGANWHEREAWEMYGFIFEGHPGLRHIYLPEEFEGHPLRKDYMLASRVVRPWPGLVDMEEMPAAQEPEQDFQ